MTTAVEQGATLIGRDVQIGTRQGKIEAIRKGRPLFNLETGQENTDTVQFQLRLISGKTWWSTSYPRQEEIDHD